MVLRLDLFPLKPTEPLQVFLGSLSLCAANGVGKPPLVMRDCTSAGLSEMKIVNK